jgi:hypothetical protein
VKSDTKVDLPSTRKIYISKKSMFFCERIQKNASISLKLSIEETMHGYPITEGIIFKKLLSLHL